MPTAFYYLGIVINLCAALTWAFVFVRTLRHQRVLKQDQQEAVQMCKRAIELAEHGASAIAFCAYVRDQQRFPEELRRQASHAIAGLTVEVHRDRSRTVH